jgi:hypothetical protein
VVVVVLVGALLLRVEIQFSHLSLLLAEVAVVMPIALPSLLVRLVVLVAVVLVTQQTQEGPLLP